MTPMTSREAVTRQTVQSLYDAYFAGDSDGMVDLMSEDVWIRFLGRADFRGKEEARRFFGQNTPLLEDLDFRIRKLIVDGAHAAALWSETARTVHGRDYANHGVDVFEVHDGKIVMVHENNDVTVHRSHFGHDD
jgi:ketosteroid isomerase-like protein